MANNFMSRKDFDEIRTMHKRSSNIEIIKELFEFLLKKYQTGLEDKMTGSEFVFDRVDSERQK